MRAAIALGTGATQEGEKLAAKVAPGFERPAGDAFMRNWVRRLQLGQVAAAGR